MWWFKRREKVGDYTLSLKLVGSIDAVVFSSITYFDSGCNESYLQAITKVWSDHDTWLIQTDPYRLDTCLVVNHMLEELLLCNNQLRTRPKEYSDIRYTRRKTKVTLSIYVNAT